MGQMVEDVKLGLEGNGEVHFYGRPGDYPHPIRNFKSHFQLLLSKEIRVIEMEESIFQAKIPSRRTPFHYCRDVDIASSTES